MCGVVVRVYVVSYGQDTTDNILDIRIVRYLPAIWCPLLNVRNIRNIFFS